MRRILSLLFLLTLLAGLPTEAQAANTQNEDPVVNSILFWSSGCPYCTQTLTDTLPALEIKYGENINILLIELEGIQDIETLYALGAQLGLSKEQVSVPFLLINHTALIGAQEIDNRINALVDEYLAQGGVEYPNLPEVGEMLSKGVSFSSFKLSSQETPPAASETKTIDMVLAWGVMALMGAALVISILMIGRAFNGNPLGKPNHWLEAAIPVLSVIGLGVSIYLFYVEATQSQAICGPVGDCNAVQNSPYAKLFGVVPIGMVGMVGYIAILVSWLAKHYRTDALARIAGPVMFGMSLFGTLFSVYLTYLEIYVIHAVCIWCLSSAALMAALMLLNLPSVTQWLAITDEEEQVLE